jgi:amidase
VILGLTHEIALAVTRHGIKPFSVLGWLPEQLLVGVAMLLPGLLVLVTARRRIARRAPAKGPLSTPAYRRTLGEVRRLARQQGIDLVMDRHRLDALVAPTTGPAILTDLVNGDQGGGGSSTLAAVAGYPHITVPAGQVCGLPVGLSFMGRAFSEPTLIRLAYAFEQATHHRRPPRLLQTADLSRP